MAGDGAFQPATFLNLSMARDGAFRPAIFLNLLMARDGAFQPATFLNLLMGEERRRASNALHLSNLDLRCSCSGTIAFVSAGFNLTETISAARRCPDGEDCFSKQSVNLTLVGTCSSKSTDEVSTGPEMCTYN